MKIHGTAKGGALSKKDFGVAFSANGGTGIDDTGLVAYWRCNQSSGDITNQSESSSSAGSSVDLTVTGATYEYSGDPVNDASLSFDGSDDNAVAGSSVTAFKFMHTDDATFTLCFWMKRISGTDTNGIFDECNNSNNNQGIMIRLRETSCLKATIFNDAGAASDPSTSLQTADNYAQTSWAFYSLTFDQAAASDNLILLRDNANEAKATKYSDTTSSKDSSNPLTLASWANDSNYANIALSEISIWNRVLDSDEITALYNSGDGQSIY